MSLFKLVTSTPSYSVVECKKCGFKIKKPHSNTRKSKVAERRHRKRHLRNRPAWVDFAKEMQQ